jgi:hypothetical protein
LPTVTNPHYPHYQVYYCNKVSHGVRFFYLVKEGLLLHPLIDFVSSPEEAEVIVYLPESAAYHKRYVSLLTYTPYVINTLKHPFMLFY